MKVRQMDRTRRSLLVDIAWGLLIAALVVAVVVLGPDGVSRFIYEAF